MMFDIIGIMVRVLFGDIISSVVMVLFGLLIGVIFVVFMAESEYLERQKPLPKIGENERTRDYWRRIGKEKAEDGVRIWKATGRSAKIAMGLFYSLIAMLIVVLYYSPVEIIWSILLISVMIGYGITHKIFSLAKAGKIRAEKQTFLDIKK